MKSNPINFLEKRNLIESKVNEILYACKECNKNFAGLVFSHDLNARKAYLIKLIESIIVKFNLY